MTEYQLPIEKNDQKQKDFYRKLRDQLLFDDYLARRFPVPAYSFRKHLREIGGAIEV